METWAGLASLYFLACSRVLSDCSADWSFVSRSRWTRYRAASWCWDSGSTLSASTFAMWHLARSRLCWRCLRSRKLRFEARANLGAVLGNTFQANQAFRKENTEHLLHQILHCTAVSHPEITQRVVIHYLHTGQPLKTRLMLPLPADLPRARNTARIGIDPDRQ